MKLVKYETLGATSVTAMPVRIAISVAVEVIITVTVAATGTTVVAAMVGETPAALT